MSEDKPPEPHCVGYRREPGLYELRAHIGRRVDTVDCAVPFEPDCTYCFVSGIEKLHPVPRKVIFKLEALSNALRLGDDEQEVTGSLWLVRDREHQRPSFADPIPVTRTKELKVPVDLICTFDRACFGTMGAPDPIRLTIWSGK